MKFIIRCISIITCTSLVALGLFGCFPNDKEIIQKSLDESLGMIQSLDPEFIDSIVNSPSGSDLTEIGIDPTELLTELLAGMTYEIGEIAVDGDAATAQINITCKNLSDILASFNTAIDSYTNDAAIADLTEEDMSADIANILIQETQNSTPVSTSQSLALELKDGVWSITEQSQSQLENLLFGMQLTQMVFFRKLRVFAIGR